MPTERVYSRPSRRQRNPRGEGGRLRGELIEAASALIAEHGTADAATIRAVARRAGVSAPSVYLHFADREALVQAVVEQRFRDLIAAVEAAVEALPADASPPQRLRAGCLGYIRFGLEHPGHYRVLFDASSAPSGEDAEQAAREAFGALVEGVAACQAAGLARPGDPFERASALWCALHGLVMLRTARPRFAWPPLEEMLDDVLTGLVGVPAAEAAA